MHDVRPRQSAPTRAACQRSPKSSRATTKSGFSQGPACRERRPSCHRLRPTTSRQLQRPSLGSASTCQADTTRSSIGIGHTKSPSPPRRRFYRARFDARVGHLALHPIAEHGPAVCPAAVPRSGSPTLASRKRQRGRGQFRPPSEKATRPVRSRCSALSPRPAKRFSIPRTDRAWRQFVTDAPLARRLFVDALCCSSPKPLSLAMIGCGSGSQAASARPPAARRSFSTELRCRL